MAEPGAPVPSRRAALGLSLTVPALAAMGVAAGDEPARGPTVLGDASVVDTAAIRAALATLPVGGILYVPPGRHRVTVEPPGPGDPAGPPRVADLRSGVGMWFDNAVLEVAGPLPSSYCVLHGAGVADVQLWGVRLLGPGTPGPSGRGIVLSGCQRIRMDGLDIDGFSGAGIVMGPGARGAPTSDSTIEASSVLNCAPHGLLLAGTSSIGLRASLFGRRDPTAPAPVGGVMLDAASADNVGVTIEGVHVDGCAVGIKAQGLGNRGLAVAASTFSNNRTALQLEGTGVSVTANSLHLNRAGIVATGDRVTLEANSVNHGGTGIDVQATAAVIRANLVRNCSRGLRVAEGSDVSRNMIKGVER